jgi:hypothetical protein
MLSTTLVNKQDIPFCYMDLKPVTLRSSRKTRLHRGEMNAACLPARRCLGATSARRYAMLDLWASSSRGPSAERRGPRIALWPGQSALGARCSR